MLFAGLDNTLPHASTAIRTYDTFCPLGGDIRLSKSVTNRGSRRDISRAIRQWALLVQAVRPMASNQPPILSEKGIRPGGFSPVF